MTLCARARPLGVFSLIWCLFVYVYCLLGDRVNKPINLLLHTSPDHSLRTFLVVARALANLNSYRSLPSLLLTDSAQGTGDVNDVVRSNNLSVMLGLAYNKVFFK